MKLPHRNKVTKRFLILLVLYILYKIPILSPSQIFTFDSLNILEDVLYLVLLLLVLGALMQFRKVDEWARRLSEDQPQSGDNPKQSWLPFGAGLALMVWAIWYLEHHQPYFFTQDDNFAQFFPVMLDGCREAFRGVFPTWNAYQYFGAPTATMGVYALTYPVTYFCYFISRFLLRNEFMTMEVFCVFHLVLGYAAVYWAGRLYRVRPWLAAAAAVSTCLSGWALIAGRSWYYVCEIFLYMPLMIVSIRYLQFRNTGWRWFVLTGIAIGAFFHAGNAQFWVYGVIFYWIAVITLWTTKEISWRDVLRAGAATLLGIGLAAPLLLPQMLQTKGVIRSMAVHFGELSGDWLAFFVPGPWINQNRPSPWVDVVVQNGGLIVYSGTTFVTFAVLVLVALVGTTGSRKKLASNLWLLCAVVALLCALGDAGLLWQLMAKLPLFNNFRLPFKFIAFINIFAILAGAIGCERLLQSVPNPKMVQSALVFFTFTAVAITCMFWLPAWWLYNVRPYPGGQEIVNVISPAYRGEYRTFSLGHARSRWPLYWEGLPHNLPTNYRVFSAWGYDPLIELQPGFMGFTKSLKQEPVNQFAELGIRFVLSSNESKYLRPGQPGAPGGSYIQYLGPLNQKKIDLLQQKSNTIFQNDAVTIWELPNTKPLAYFETEPTRPVQISVRGNGLDVDTSQSEGSGRFVLNFYWYKDMKAVADGRAIPIARDSFSRMIIDLPKGTHKLQIRFRPPWMKANLLALMLILFGVGVWMVSHRHAKVAA